MFGVETQKSLVDKVNKQFRSIPNFQMITYNISNEMRSEELESLLVPSISSSASSSNSFSSSSSSSHPLSHLNLYGMIGLHCCGDLSASMCRMFIDSGDRCRVLAFVGCCYNLLTTRESNPAGIFGFPLNPEVTVRMGQRVRNAIVQVCGTVCLKNRTRSSIRLRRFSPV